MKLNHYALNQPNTGLNGWRDWLKTAIQNVAKIIPFGGFVAEAVLFVIDEIDNSNFQWHNNNRNANIPEDWEPTPSEASVLNAFAQNALKNFINYLVSVEAAIKSNSTYTGQLNEYNKLLKSYAIFKDYHKTHEISGLSENAILTKIELLDVFVRELNKRLEEIFNVIDNTTTLNVANNLAPGDSFSFGSITLNVQVPFTSSFNNYQPKQIITTTNPQTGQTSTSNPTDTLVSISLPTKPVEVEKTYLFGLINYSKRPIASTLLTGVLLYSGYKLVRKIF